MTLLSSSAFGWPERFVAETWHREQGLPQNSVHAVVQDRDGYLWMGTDDGLARFDGVSFTVLDRGNSPELVSDAVRALAPASDGGLWVATRRGLYRYAENRFTAYAAQDGLAQEDLLSLYLDRQGRLWIGTGDGAASFDGRAFTVFTARDGQIEGPVWAIHQDKNGDLWFGTDRGLNRLADGRFTTFTVADGLSHDHVRALGEDREGRLWIGTAGGLTSFADGRFTVYSVADGLADPAVLALEDDGEGGLWIGTDNGLSRLSGESRTPFGPDVGVPPDLRIRSLWRDREGNLWIGTSASGAVKLAEATFTALGGAEGLADDLVWVVYQDRAGAVWIGTNSGLNRVDGDGAVTTYASSDGLPDEDVRSVAEDREGSLWVGTNVGGLARLENGAFEVYTPDHGLASLHVATLLVDRDGTLWIGTDRGLSRLADGAFTTYTTRDGLAHDHVRILYEDSRGELWIGTEGGLSRRTESGFATVALARGDLGERIRSLHADRRGDLWIGTAEHGLLRYREGEVTAFSVADGLFDYLVHQILEDDQGSLWMSSNQGVFQTWTFYAVCAGAVVLLASGFHRLRLGTVLRHNEELRQMQRRLEAKNAEAEERNVELKGFTYTVSHDLKSPLVTILGFLGFLERDIAAGKTDRVESDIRSIRNAATKMQRLLDELLELSRIGRVTNPPQEVDLGELAREAADLVAGRIAARGVEVAIDSGLPTVVGDRPRLLQVMQNLIDNAVKFMGDESAPRIEIGGRREGPETLCWVRDNGIGIDPRFHQKVFGLFDQLDSRAEGTGMGLAMVKRIVETHGGWIRVESEGEGRGTTFVFSIPAPSPEGGWNPPYDSMPSLRRTSGGGPVHSVATLPR